MRRGGVVKIPGAETYPLYEALPWPVYDFEIALRPIQGLAAIYQHRYRDHRIGNVRLRWWRARGALLSGECVDDVSKGPAGRWLPWPMEGVFVPRGWSPADELPRTREYDPLVEADQMLQLLSRLDLENPAAILGFVRRWGLLDQGEYASVAETKIGLSFIKELASQIHRASRGPDLSELAFDLTVAVASAQHAVRDVEGSLRIVFKAPRLMDALGLRLAEVATRYAEPLRRCEYGRCGALFVPGRRDQRYCQTGGGEQVCARRASLERFRAGQRRKGRSKERQRRRTRR